MNNLQKIFFTIGRIVLGIVFIYSGYVKGIDPLGSTYKFTDYFTAFGMRQAIPIAFSLSVLQSAAEFIIGIALLLNLKTRLASIGALIFMIIFTPLTLYIAIKNPVHDCGCFGDALVITNWQTFWKNVVLLIPAIYLFAFRKKVENKRLSFMHQWVMIGIFTIFILSLTAYCYRHLPIQDFRPYKVGVYIPDGMIIPEDAPTDEYKSTFIYSKNDEQKEFGIDNIPDSTWTFVEAKHELIKKGYTPPIHDFTITTTDGIDLTDQVLANPNYSIMLVAYDINKTSIKNSDKVNKLVDFCKEKGYNFFGLTSSNTNDVSKFLDKTNGSYPFYNTDEITLKTIVRSNPGLVLLKEGTILGKWHINDIDNMANTVSNTLIQKDIKQ